MLLETYLLDPYWVKVLLSIAVMAIVGLGWAYKDTISKVDDIFDYHRFVHNHLTSQMIMAFMLQSYDIGTDF